MRRNTITILKYLVFAAVFLTLGPVTLRMIFGSNGEGADRPARVGGQGMPEDPDVIQRRHDAEVDDMVSSSLKSPFRKYNFAASTFI